MTYTIDPKQLRRGMPVQSGEGRTLGVIEHTDADSITVKGQQYELSSVERIEGDPVSLTRRIGASADRGAGGRARSETVAADGDVRVRGHTGEAPLPLGPYERRLTRQLRLQLQALDEDCALRSLSWAGTAGSAGSRRTRASASTADARGGGATSLPGWRKRAGATPSPQTAGAGAAASPSAAPDSPHDQEGATSQVSTGVLVAA